MVLSLAAVALCAFVLSLVLTPGFRDVAWRLGWLDAPDRKRKIHCTSVPSAGGIPIFLACAAAAAVPVVLPMPGSGLARAAFPAAAGVLCASLIVLAVGLLDDVFGLTPWRKLVGQSAAAAAAFAAGVEFDGIAGYAVPAWIAFPAVVLWLLACTNAFNLIDGVDGLAPGIGLVGAATAGVAGLLHGDAVLALLGAVLAGGLLGFLPFNFNPASLFLGDTGSLWAGFLLGCCGVLWMANADTLPDVAAPLMALAVPLCDTTLAIARRFLRCQSVFSPDRGHIHHRLLDRGYGPRQAVLVLYGASALAAVLALLITVVRGEARWLVLALFFAAAWFGTRQLGYDEFRIAARLASLANFRELVRAQLRLCKLEESMAAARTAEDCWCPVREAAREFGFSSVSLRLGEYHYIERIGNGYGCESTLKVQLSASDYVALTFHGPASEAAAPFVNILYRALHDKPLAQAARPGPGDGGQGPGDQSCAGRRRSR